MVCLAEGNVLRVLTQKKVCRTDQLFYLDQPHLGFLGQGYLMVQEPASSDEVLLFLLKYGLAFGLRGDVRVVGPGSVNGTKHLSRDLLLSTHDSVMHAARIYSL